MQCFEKHWIIENCSVRPQMSVTNVVRWLGSDASVKSLDTFFNAC